MLDGSNYYSYQKRVKKELTMEDFMGLVQWEAQDGMPTLENVETIGIFADLFRLDYQDMNPSKADINQYLKGILISGEFDHKAYHPIRDFVSAVADVTIILPLIESITGKDYITGEDLTDFERSIKGLGAIVDIATFGNGAVLTNAAKGGVKEFTLAVAKTMAVDALASGTSYLAGEMLEDMGLPQGASTVLTALVSGAVTYSAGKYFFKDATGKVIGEYTEEELEKVIKGEIDNNISPEIPKVKGSVADELIEGGKDVPTAFRQTEFASSYDARINQTPSLANKKVQFVGDRGESLCVLKPPPDPELERLLNEAGVDGILYRNAVPDFSPVSRAEVEIDYMLGGIGADGNKARELNFQQANARLVEQLNESPELAQAFGMEAGNIKVSDIEKYRVKNNLTWHELNDGRTLQLVPSEINSSFGHLGGVGEINAGLYKQ